MESLALFCGIFGILSSIIAIVVVFLTRKNIVDIIDKEVILFEGNFNTKKDAITSSFELCDEILLKGKQATYNTEFLARARKCYNNLYCVVTNTNVAREFLDIAVNPSSMVNQARVNEYKNMCRKDIGFKVKKNKQTSIDFTYVQPIQQSQPVQQSQEIEIKRSGRPRKDV